MNYKSFDEESAFDLLRAARVAGRKIAVIGGGTGLSTLLLGLKEYTDNITAIVTVTDDGGGSGVIRSEFGVLPPGDIRNCVLSLANTSSTMSDLLNYRFTDGSLKGQNFGNLFLLALNGICGSFDLAVARMNQFLAVTGQVLPVTNRNIVLKAVFENGSVVLGETAITAVKRQSGLAIKRMELQPSTAVALDTVIEAIDDADIIILGPGSLYTSIIPNLLVGNVANAIKKSEAAKLYVMNIMTQEGETEQYSAHRHADEINAHACGGIIDACIYNSQPIHKKLLEKYIGQKCNQIFPDFSEFESRNIKLFGGDMLAHGNEYARHDPLRLAYYIMEAAEKMVPREGILGEYDKLLLKME